MFYQAAHWCFCAFCPIDIRYCCMFVFISVSSARGLRCNLLLDHMVSTQQLMFLYLYLVYLYQFVKRNVSTQCLHCWLCFLDHISKEQCHCWWVRWKKMKKNQLSTVPEQNTHQRITAEYGSYLSDKTVSKNIRLSCICSPHGNYKNVQRPRTIHFEAFSN